MLDTEAHLGNIDGIGTCTLFPLGRLEEGDTLTVIGAGACYETGYYYLFEVHRDGVRLAFKKIAGGC